jgi:hypothetical protein
MRTITEQYPGRFAMDIAYPRFYEQTPAAEAADQAISDWTSSEQKRFLTQALEQIRDLGVPTGPYEYRAASEVTLFSPSSIISVTYDSYEYLGGAHGISSYRVFNYGIVRGTATPLTLTDFFERGYDCKTHVSHLVLMKLREDENATLVRSGQVEALTDEQLNRFQIRPEGLTFLFNHYEVAPYSGGRFQVTLTAEELGPGFDREKAAGH